MPRELKRGDSFLPISSVDLAVSLWTMDFPFFDPDTPYTYRQIGNKRAVQFFFDVSGVNPQHAAISDCVRLWPEADRADKLPASISVCKRTIWERRWILKEIHKPQLYELKHNSNIEEVREVKLAAIAYALGFEKPNPAIVHGPNSNEAIMLVGKTAPAWLNGYGVKTLSDLSAIMQDEIGFVNTPGNEMHPIALAIASYINIVAFLDHFRNEAKPYMQFTLTNGRQLWVREGSPRYNELLEAGYYPA